MTIVDEAGKVTRHGRAKLRAVPAGEPKPKRAKAPTNCALCGKHADRLIDVHGNKACEACAMATQSDENVAAADEAKAKRKAKAPVAPKAPAEIAPRSMAALAGGYAAFMESNGKTPATVASYRNDLGVALRELGADTLVADLTTERVAAYFTCDAVTLLRSGGTKSQLSIDKTRRVLRLALEWAASEGWIAKAPIPAKS